MVKKNIYRCPVCQSDNIEHIYSIQYSELFGLLNKYEQKINVCNLCQLIFIANPIDNNIMSEYYKLLSKYEGKNNIGDVSEDKQRMAKRQYDFLSNYLEDIENILEIGASTGFNLDIYQKKNISAFGIEPSEMNKKIASKKYNVNLFAGTFEEYIISDKNNRKYDLVFMSHVLEHIPNLSIFINDLKQINSKYLFVEVPAFDSQVLNAEPLSFFIEHVNYFTVESLSHALAKGGYSPVKVHIQYNYDDSFPDFPVIVSLWKKNDNPLIINNVFKSKFLLEEYIKKNSLIFDKFKYIINKIDDNAKLAVWGTGSHTSKLLGMTNLSEKNIIKFYDSDKKKHQFKMLGKDITSFNIRDIEEGIIDTILISTRSGEASIKSYLETLSIKINIIYLYH